MPGMGIRNLDWTGLGSNLKSQSGRIAGMGMNWAKDNKVMAAGAGLGALGLGYSAYRMLSPNEFTPGPDYKAQQQVADSHRRGQGYDGPPEQRAFSTPQPNVVRLPSMQEIELTEEDILKAEMKQYREEQKNLKEAALANIYGNSLPNVRL
jgi:hypothetical protein